MKILAHVFNTWLLANFLHPICWIAMDIFQREELDLLFYLMFFLYSLFASLAALLISWFILTLIISSRYTIYEKIFLWYFSGIVFTFLGIELLSILSSKEFISLKELFYITPVVVPVILSITIRYRFFVRLASSNNKN